MDPVQKFLRRVDRTLRERLIRAVDAIHADDLDDWDVQPLTGKKDWFRCRVGNVRIIFVRVEARNIVVDMDFRGNVYKK